MKRIRIFLFAAIIAFSCLNPYLHAITLYSEAALGDLIYYNAIIRNDFLADQADTEGALAVGGNLTAPALSNHSYSVGAAYAGANGQHIGQEFDESHGPALLLGGSYTNLGSGIHVLGDYTSFPGNISPYIQILGKHHEIHRQDILDQIENMVERADIYLARALSYGVDQGYPINGGGGWNSSDTSFYLAKEDTSINIGLVNGENIGELYLPSNILNQEATIIVSFEENINFLQGGTLFEGSIIDVNQLYNSESIMTKIASRIIYYFPYAKEVALDHQAVIGSIFAPQANFIATGGSINGQAVFNSASVFGGFEFHNFNFSWRRGFATGELKLSKMNRETHEPLKDAEFSIFSLENDQIIATATSDETGELFFKNIPYGRYVLRETSSPPGFISDFEDTVFEINAKQQMVVLRAYNTPTTIETGSLRIIKSDKQTNEKLAGAKFELRQYSDDVLISVGNTNKEGLLEFKDIPLGLYRVIETEAPLGYLLNQNNEHLVRVNSSKILTIIVENEKESNGEFIIRKRNVLGEPLSGAIFSLWDSQKNEVITETTDAFGIIRIKNLELGEYSYREIQAPEGYALDDTERTFRLSYDFQVINHLLTNYIKDDPPNLNSDGYIKLIKTDVQNSSLRLQGAEFLLTNIETKEKHTLITDVMGEAEKNDLPYGAYQLEELNPPAGYIAEGTSVNFIIDQFSKDHEYTFRNRKTALRLGSISIHKYDKDTYESLAGAKFELTHIETNYSYQAITNESGDARFSNLEMGSYLLKEVDAPEGYERKSEIVNIDISPLHLQHIFPYPNTKIDTHEKQLTIQKVDQYNLSVWLKGAQFRIEDEFGAFLARGITDDYGSIKFSDLSSSLEKVYLIEEIAPHGYEIYSEPIEISLNIPGVDSYYKQVSNKKRSGKIVIQKKLSNLIYGQEYDFTKIQLRLYGNSSNQSIFNLNSEGYAELDLPPGFYSIQEIRVPDNMIINMELYRFEIKSDETYLLDIVNQAIDPSITVWLTKSDDLMNRLNDIPFELFVEDVEGHSHSKGIVFTGYQSPPNYHGNGIAVWENLYLSELFSHDGTALFKHIYAIERESEIELNVIQDLNTKYFLTIDKNSVLNDIVQVINPESLNGEIINKRITPIDPEPTKIETTNPETNPTETEPTEPELTATESIPLDISDGIMANTSDNSNFAFFVSLFCFFYSIILVLLVRKKLSDFR